MDDDFELVPFYTDDDLPPYAILSYIWSDGQEVTYDELVAGAAKSKAGFAKIRLGGERAAQDSPPVCLGRYLLDIGMLPSMDDVTYKCGGAWLA